ncbi:class I adenylate-forming enzyme family protein [Cupriavidus agavae]|uniref:Acyl-coenzyme A synthetase/AMP-(Fatty) acid ligase n=1 Tax=Cupriavidus agavae TaxID=1001822 RepID=A0A4Q7RXK7_9BURK|nr:acyl-CoA synthetase [Cupriavidus agavae]RZT38615.1 acyl-coenzyme A synthetase/AMP-(fatty) acid ligase [Cupriavidus agavae]
MMTTITILSGAVALCALLLYLVHVAREIGIVSRLACLRHVSPPHVAILSRAARRTPDRILVELDAPLGWHAPAVGQTHAPCEWSARAIYDTVRLLAGVLKARGVAPNDRVAIYKANAFDIFLFSAASNWLGAVAAPINANLAPAIAGPYIGRLGATVLVTDREGLERLKAAGLELCNVPELIVVDAPERDVHAVPDGPRMAPLSALLGDAVAVGQQAPCGADDLAFIFHTSGTTGVPKGVMVAAGGLIDALRSVLKFNLVSPRDYVYFALPLNHQVSHLYLYAIMLLGVRTCLGSRLDARHALDTIESRRVTTFFGFPITYTKLLAAGAEARDLSSIRIWGTTADASHEVHQRAFVRHGSFFRRLGIPKDGAVFLDGLGSTEVGIAALLRIVTPWTRQFGRRVGRPTPGGPRVKVVDEAGSPAPTGQPGRLMIKGPAMFRGYWNAHDLLMKATHDGWWATGDMVMRVAGGEYVHLDREVDVIRGATGHAYTLLIEEFLLKHPDVMDVSVFGVTGPDGVAMPAAVVALHPGVSGTTGEQLRTAWNAVLGPTDKLAYVWIEAWSSFPIGATGKTLDACCGSASPRRRKATCRRIAWRRRRRDGIAGRRLHGISQPKPMASGPPGRGGRATGCARVRDGNPRLRHPRRNHAAGIGCG